MTEQAVDAASSRQFDAEELGQQTTSAIALALAAVGAILWLSVEPGPSFSWWQVFLFFTLCAEGLAAYALVGRHPRMAQAVLLVGPIFTLGTAMRVIGSPTLPYLATLAVIANSAISLPLGLVAAALSTVVLIASASSQGPMLPPVVLVLCVTALQWISTRARGTVLGWAWSSQRHASRLLEELRDRQGQLNRALHAMDEANARLAMANERLAEARRLAEEARQAKARFAASVSHELRTPLNVILGFVEVMYTTPQAYPDVVLSSEFLMDLGAVHSNVQHLGKLVDDVLDLAQLEEGKFTLQPIETALPELIQEAVDAMRSLATVGDLDIVVQADPDLPPVRADRTRIKQVLLNLLTNAARYAGKGSVTVRVTCRGREVWCAVEDTGTGIPEEHQKRLFQEFERLEGGPSTSRTGSGLGLAISKRLVEEHGGRIWVESTPGVGSTFTFALPVHGDELALATTLQAARPVGLSPHTEREPVLILTASLTAVRLFSRHLHSYHCVCTSDPEQTVRQIAALQPRGVIIDVAQGPEAVERVGRAVAETAIPSIPVITCQMPSESPAPILAHVGGYLTKPVTRQDLLDALRTLGREVETVLVVDDAEDVLRVFTHYLQDDPTRPHRVMSARNGCEALQLMRREPPDLVLLDLVMPVLDGYQVLEEMQRSHELADIPVILVTGQDAQVEHAAMVGRMEAWMPKGMSVDQLLRGTNDLIRALLGATPAPSPAEGEASP